MRYISDLLSGSLHDKARGLCKTVSIINKSYEIQQYLLLYLVKRTFFFRNFSRHTNLQFVVFEHMAVYFSFMIIASLKKIQ